MKTLDVQKIYELIDDGDKNALNGVAAMLYEIYKDNSGYIQQVSMQLDENVHFYEGRQHLQYNNTIKSYVPRPITKFNRHIPRPVTNYLYPIVNTLVAMLSKNRPQFRILANSDKPEDKNRAQLADAILNAKYEIDEEQRGHIWAAKIAILLGTVYRKDFWDTTGLQEVKYRDDYGKSGYKTKKEMGKEYDKDVERESMDKPEALRSAPLGDNRVCYLTPFQLIPDYENAIKSLEDGFYIMEANVHPVDYIKAVYNKKGKGYTGEAANLKPDKNLSKRLDYFERMKGMSNNSQHGERPENSNSCVLIEAYIKPNKKHPKGLMIVCAGEKVLYYSESPYTYGDGVNWHPYTMFRYDINPMKHHGGSVVSQLVPLQRRLNSIDALSILNRKTNASPQWLIPQGCLTPEQTITGAPGQLINTKVVNGMVPTKVPGLPLDSSVYKERENVIQEMFMISGVNEVLTGNQPSGVNTATALQILLEQTTNKFNPILQDLSKFIEEGQSKKINLIRRMYKEPREDLINRVRALNKDNTEVQIDDLFTGEALGDNLDVRVEGQSMMPRSSVVEQSLITQMIQMGLYGDLTPQVNPKGNAEMLRKFGAPVIPNQTVVDIKKAEWENDCMRQGKFDDAIVMPTDDHVTHYIAVKTILDKPEFYQTHDEDVVAKFWEHLLNHFVRMPEEAYPQVGIFSARQIREMQEFAMSVGASVDELQPDLEARVANLEAMAAQLNAATAGQAPVGEPAPFSLGETGGSVQDIIGLNEGTIPPGMA